MEYLVDIFNSIFEFMANGFSNILYKLFYGCEERGNSLIAAIDSVFQKISYSNYITFFIGAFFTLALIRLTLFVISTLKP